MDRRDAAAGGAGLPRPVIGVTGGRRGGRLLWGFARLALWRAGARPVPIRPGRPLPSLPLAGLVIGGGEDIGLELYDGSPVPAVPARDPERDRLEHELARQAMARGLPLLGVCRGAQMINIACGGSLHPDIREACRTAPRLRTVLPRKAVAVERRSLLRCILGTDSLRVNALHHQSVDRLGRGLSVVARDRWGIVQAVEGPGCAPGWHAAEGPPSGAPFVLGVQWHPELLPHDRRQLGLFRALVAAARRRGA